MDFNTITTEQEKTAIAKFNQHNAGIIVSQYAGTRNLRGADASKYADLMDVKLFDLNTLVAKLKEIGRTINNEVVDDVIGDSSIMFTTHNAKDEQIKFSYVETYSFLRGIIRERKEAADYRSKKAQLTAAEALIEGAKSPKERRKEAEAQVAALRIELGLDVVPAQD